MKNIVNIINFIRGIEPRPGRNIDLVKPVREQIRIMKELHIRAAQSQKSLQDYVTDLIRKDLCPYQQSSLLPEQKAALNDLSKEALSVVEKMEDILRPEQQEHGGMRFG